MIAVGPVTSVTRLRIRDALPVHPPEGIVFGGMGMGDNQGEERGDCACLAARAHVPETPSIGIDCPLANDGPRRPVPSQKQFVSAVRP